jgi:hypothetical protein
MPQSKAFAALALALAGATPASAAPAPLHMFYSRGAVPDQLLIGQVLVSHNVERRRVGLAPLAWDPQLADGARLYAYELVRSTTLRHSPKVVRPGIGENLWKGTRGYFARAAMVGGWVSERAMFLNRPGLRHYARLISAGGATVDGPMRALSLLPDPLLRLGMAARAWVRSRR